ncbi:hypothetical protein BOTBODRAFT_587408 [Botryobasidium botryosum FD-172 SS1]|uniref:Zn(2)-C6 fungal-type domain-containing protein n=1 Tax=Botryobasidium botryosum (strain FD-172 SS1) TaxID=930990 RepID=A0A067LXP5_BOTB1|nr:hypothetical protein BOTBODRAFT_587408 [Botryobasidium botryosum FD-172 SS1]
MTSAKPALGRGEACLQCRRRKLRCDAVKPVCGPCARLSEVIDCVYTPSRRQILEQRVLVLESRISALTVVHHATATPKAPEDTPNERVHTTSSIRSAFPPPFSIPMLVPAHKPNLGLLSPRAVVVRPLEDPDIARWKTEKEVPPGVRNHLIALFIQFRRSHPFQFNVPRFIFLLDLPPSHHRASHPVLSNAAMLYGCLYAENTVRQLFERALIHRVRKGLQNALAHADRLVDCTKALTLLGCYFYSIFRPLVGHYYVSAAMSLAIACGLHKIDSLDLNSQTTISLVDPAVDLIELGDRINTFWTILSLDRTGSLLSGAVPCGPSDEAITTLLPCPSEYYEYANASLQQYGALWASHDPESPFNCDSRDNPLELRVKAYALFSKASLLLVQSQRLSGGPDGSLSADAWSIIRAISALTDRLEAFQFNRLESADISSMKSALFAASGTAHAAMLQINDVLPKDDPGILGRQRIACKGVVLAAREISKLGDEYFPLIFGLALVPAHQFLVRTTENKDDGCGEAPEFADTHADIQELLYSLGRIKTLLPSEAAAPVDRMWQDPIFV